ncbi:MAG TPA: peptide chain release factor N(5)-glutamine methyltransferase, partial [Ktedonobacter sp.]|nr:peptide chain release factor N(5)-glutamine methyltransferase [Ktedonobacter sp.]
MMTIKDALKYGKNVLMQHSPASSTRRDVYVLLEHVLQTNRTALYAYPERELTAEQEQHYLSLLQRHLHNEPLAYLTGHQEFYGLDFVVDNRVLIPRPETELLIEETLRIVHERLNTGQTPVVADIGTGSGAIPITLAVEEPRLPLLYGVDISPDALDVARINCEQHHVEERVRLLQGDLLAPLPEPVDIITANLPYVGLDERDILTPDVYDYEPHLALFSGQEGLDLLQRFLQEVQQGDKIRNNGILLLEIGYRQRAPLVTMLNSLFPNARVLSKKDYAGWDRMLQVYL